MKENTKFTIIGGGPVGLAVALLLAKEGYYSDVFEGRKEILNDYEQSYPIGINPRTLHTLNLINPKLEEEAKSSGIVINSWEIYAGSRKVANQKSGAVYGTSRAMVNLLLYKEALNSDKIKIYYNHKLVEIDSLNQELIFEIKENDKKNRVMMKAHKLIAADGVNSVVRNHLEKNNKDFKCEIIPWTNEYRILYSKPGAESSELDPKIHYIYAPNFYVATILNDNQQIWSVSVCSRDNDDEESKRLFYSNEATDENKSKLLQFIKKKAPTVHKFFENNHEEIEKYFKRRSYRGAIVKCNRVNDGEWILLMGDAAHSLLPPTGEGINSGLEDAYILYECLKRKGINDLFSNYNKERIPDLHGLYDYAKYLNENPLFPGEAASRLIFMIFSSCFKRKIFNELFGDESRKRLPYSDISDSWQTKKFWILNFARCICIPIALVFFLIMPWRWGLCCKKKSQNNILKPPIQ